MPKPISAAIITLNEERNIADVINSVKRVCDEIIVVDSLSSDKTVEIATSMGAKVISQKFLGDGKQKALCEEYATNDWVLSIDADERLEDEAVEAILTLDLEGAAFDAFSLRRKSFIGTKYVRQWYPDRVVRLYNKSKCGYNDSSSHAAVNASHVKQLDIDMLHYSFDDFAMMIDKSKRYAVEFAQNRYDEGKRASWYDPFTHGFMAFLKGLIFKGGILGGTHEWHVAFVSAYNSYMKYVIMLEIAEKESERK